MAYSRPRRLKAWGTGRAPMGKLKRAIARKAPKRFNWYAVDSPCAVPILPFHRCQDSETFDTSDNVQNIDPADGSVTGPGIASRISIFDPEDPGNPGQTQTAEDVTIVAIRGFVMFIPIWAPRHIDRNSGEEQYSCDEIRLVRQNQGYFFRAGLKKDTFITPIDNQQQYVAPYRDPMVPDNFADGRFLKMWQREKYNTSSMGGNALCPEDFLAICADVHGGADNIVPPIASGDQPGYTIDTRVSTTCTEYTEANVVSNSLPATTFPHGQADRPFNISLNSRRRIRLRESEGLSFWFNYTAPDILGALTVDAPRVLHNAAVSFAIRIHFKVLLETS